MGRVGETSNGAVIENRGNRAVRNTTRGRRRYLRLRLGRGHHPAAVANGRHHLHHLYLPCAGGILGTNEGMDVYNCYNAGRIDTNGATERPRHRRPRHGQLRVAGCWYLTGCDDDPASNGYWRAPAARSPVSVTAADQKIPAVRQSVIAALNANGAVFAQDTAGKTAATRFCGLRPSLDRGLPNTTAAANGTFTLSAGMARPPSARPSVLRSRRSPTRATAWPYHGVESMPILWRILHADGDERLGRRLLQKVKTATIIKSGSRRKATCRRPDRLPAHGGGRMEYVERARCTPLTSKPRATSVTLQTHSYADAIPADGCWSYREGAIGSRSRARKERRQDLTPCTGDGTVVIEAVRAYAPQTGSPSPLPAGTPAKRPLTTADSSRGWPSS